MTKQGSIAGPPDAPQSGDADTVSARIRSAAERALAEAAARRAKAPPAVETTEPREVDGRDGPEPIRFGDWEVKGVASDF